MLCEGPLSARWSPSPCLAGAAPAHAAGPPPLSRDTSPANVASEHGSGIFGRWSVDGWGLPAYRYTIDPDTDPRAPQPELNGNRDAWHQLGNDHIVATAHNRGHVQLWSQDRIYQWTNRYEPDAGHYAAATATCASATGRSARSTPTAPRARRPSATSAPATSAARRSPSRSTIEEHVYAPFGDDPRAAPRRDDHEHARRSRSTRAGSSTGTSTRSPR